jgi:hypothetical protein
MPRSCQSGAAAWHDGVVNADQIAALRMLLAPTGWLERAAEFAHALRGSARAPGSLLLVGTPEHEPWHFAAHLDDEARIAGVPELAPTLVRWAPPPGAPPHLSVGLARLGEAGRGDSLVVVSPQAAPDRLLERVCDARRSGTTILALDRGDGRLAGVAHEELSVAAGAPLTFDAAQHLVSAAAGDRAGRGGGLRARLSRLLDAVSGPVCYR